MDMWCLQSETPSRVIHKKHEVWEEHSQEDEGLTEGRNDEELLDLARGLEKHGDR